MFTVLYAVYCSLYCELCTVLYCTVQVLERGEAKYAEKMEDIRILKLEIRRLRLKLKKFKKF